VPKAMVETGNVIKNGTVFEGHFYPQFTKTYKPGGVKEDSSLMNLKPATKPVVIIKETSDEEVREEWFSHVVDEFQVLSHEYEDDWFIKEFLGV